MPDRFGELADDQADTVGEHRCDGGWIDRDADHPIPCLACKPHLARRPHQTTETVGVSRESRSDGAQ